MRAPSAGREQDLGTCHPLNHSPVPWPLHRLGWPAPGNRTDLKGQTGTTCTAPRLPCSFLALTRRVPCSGGHLAARPALPVDAGGTPLPHVSTS